MNLTVLISNPLRGEVRQLTCPVCTAELPTLFPAVEVRLVSESTRGRNAAFRPPDDIEWHPRSSVPGYGEHNGDNTIVIHFQIPFPLLCCTTNCERRLMTQRRISPVVVEAKIDDGTRKKKRQ